MAHGALGMNRAGQGRRDEFPRFGGKLGIWCSCLCQPRVHTLTLPPIFAWRIRFGGEAAPVQIYKSAGFPRGALTTLIKPRLRMH